MKKTVLLTGIALAASAVASQATLLFSDTFSYPNGNLVGQGPWLQTGTIATTPVQVTSGNAVVGTSGQDIYAPLSGGIYTIPDNTSFDVGLDLTVQSAQATGDYFLHTTPTVGNSTSFPDRVEIKSSGVGYVLGYSEQSGTGSSITYGTTVLDFNTTYRVVLVYDDVAGTLNDTASIYVAPTDTSVEGNNMAYVTKTWSTSTAESDAVAALNLRQGSAGAAAGLSVDNLNAGTAFSEVATFNALQTPEPTSFALLTLGGMAGAFFFGRRNRK